MLVARAGGCGPDGTGRWRVPGRARTGPKPVSRRLTRPSWRSPGEPGLRRATHSPAVTCRAMNEPSRRPQLNAVKLRRTGARPPRHGRRSHPGGRRVRRRRRAAGRRRGVGAARRAARARARRRLRVGGASRRDRAARAGRARHRPTSPRRADGFSLPDLGVARRGSQPAAGHRRAVAVAAVAGRRRIGSSWRHHRRRRARCRWWSTACWRARWRAWRCAAWSTTPTRGPCGSRWASVHTTARRSSCCTATGPPPSRSPTWFAPSPPIGSPAPRGTRSTCSRRSVRCVRSWSRTRAHRRQ